MPKIRNAKNKKWGMSKCCVQLGSNKSLSSSHATHELTAKSCPEFRWVISWALLFQIDFTRQNSRSSHLSRPTPSGTSNSPWKLQKNCMVVIRSQDLKACYSQRICITVALFASGSKYCFPILYFKHFFPDSITIHKYLITPDQLLFSFLFPPACPLPPLQIIFSPFIHFCTTCHLLKKPFSLSFTVNPDSVFLELEK